MAKEKVTFEQFITSVSTEQQSYVQDLHGYLLENGCKVTFEEKKSGYLASYKFGKPIRAVANFVFRKQGMIVRIYGEHVNKYEGFLETLPENMIKTIVDAGECKRLVNNTCSPKCSGYDFMLGGNHLQKCRYGCFELLVTDENKSFIRAFVENELKER